MVSKLSIYDLLAMVIPGGIIIAAICQWLCLEIPVSIEELCCGCKVIVKNYPPAWVWIVFSVATYFVGLINNWIADGVFRGFRNNSDAIKNALRKVLHDNENIYLKSYDIIVHNKAVMEVKGLWKDLRVVSKYICIGWNKDQDSCNFSLYYGIYYTLSQKNLLGSIPILEAQVAFIRNCLGPIFALACVLGFKQCFCFAFILGIMLMALFVVMVQPQNKVYQMVWEAANYYKL